MAWAHRSAAAFLAVTLLSAVACNSSGGSNIVGSSTIYSTPTPCNSSGSSAIHSTLSRTASSTPLPTATFNSEADPFADIAEHFPGFGGSYQNPDDGTGKIQLCAYLTDTTIDLDPLKKAILYKFYPSNVDPDSVAITALPGRYDWRQLVQWYALAANDVWAAGGIVSTDIQESKNRLEYGVLDEAAVAAVTSALINFGVPADAFEVHVAAPVVAY